MAYAKIQPIPTIHLENFTCDTVDDIATLPKCLPGSQAVVIATGDLYVANSNGEWVKFGGEA